jgi:diguanylate cyclase (GGDEF)-like protein
MTGYSEAELLGRTLRSLSDTGADDLAFDRMDEGFATGEPFDAEVSLRLAAGPPRLFGIEVHPVRQGDGELGHFIVHEKDVSQNEVAADVLKRADTDPLTGLANRFLFDKMLGRAIERGLKNPNLHFGVLFLDLDRFKKINDSRGHVTGDQLLIAVARELEQAVRPGDVVARFGGDEFVVLVDLVGGLREVVAVAERISERLAEPIALEGGVFSLSASIGIAVSDTGYTTIDEVLRDADIAMYQAKQQGGGGYRIFDAKLREGIAAANSVRNALQESLARGEFRLHYQPLVDLHSNRVTGLEALLRWEHPERGTVSAADFIALAEDSGLILPIGRWVIREACRQLASWKQQLGSEVDPTLSVNLSSRELLSPELPSWIQQSLEETGADPASLRIEIPESFIAESTQEVTERFRELRALGIQISIGDFAGSALSLRQLLRFPVDTLKIDCRLFFSPSSWLEDSAEAAMNERVLRSILAVAASLDVEVVASAVETRLQWETLRRLSFRVGQGYLFSKPVEATGAQNLFRKVWNDRTSKEPHPA